MAESAEFLALRLREKRGRLTVQCARYFLSKVHNTLQCKHIYMGLQTHITFYVNIRAKRSNHTDEQISGSDYFDSKRGYGPNDVPYGTNSVWSKSIKAKEGTKYVPGVSVCMFIQKVKHR